MIEHHLKQKLRKKIRVPFLSELYGNLKVQQSLKYKEYAPIIGQLLRYLISSKLVF